METELSRVVDALPGFVWTALPDGQIDFFNRRWCDYTALSVERSCGRGWQAAVHPEDLSRLLAGWQDVTASAPVETEARVRGAGGEYRWFVFRAEPSADASGRVAKWCGVSTDIDERKQAGESQQTSAAIDGIPGLVAILAPNGYIETVNRRLLEYYGNSIEHLRRWATNGAIHSEDLPHVIEILNKSLAAGVPYEIEHRMRRHDGAYLWFSNRAIPARNDAGQIVRWHVLLTDIEDRKRAEALLAGEKQLLEMVANGRPMPDVLQALCRTVEGMTSRCSCSIVLADPSGTKLQEAIAPSLPAEFNDAVRGWPLDRVGGPCVMAARDKTQVIMSDVASDARWRNSWRALAQKHGLKSCWSTPIVSQAGKVLGTFALYQREPGTPTPLQLELIAQFTNIASIAIERAQRDAALRQSEARLALAERELQLTIDSSPAMMGTLRPDGTLDFVNQTYRDYTGLTMLEATEGKRNDYHPDDVERISDAWRRSLTTGEPFQMDLRLRRGDGTYRWHTLRRTPLRDENGRIIKWYGVASDIEDRKVAEEALRRSEARLAEAERELQVTIDTIPTLVATYRADGSRLFVNRTWLDYTGLSLDAAMDAERADLAHPDDAARVADEWQRSLAAGIPFKTEMRLRRADGEHRWHAVHRVAARDETGAIVKWYSVAADIEDRKRAEEALRRSELDSRSVLDGIPGLVATLTPGGEVEAVNRQIVDYCGQSLEELKNWGTNGTVHEADLPNVAEIFTKSIASGVAYRIEQRLRRFDGEYLWFDNRGIPVRDEAGRIVRWYVLLTDIEDRKRVEEALRANERNSRLIVDSIPGLVSTFTPEGEFEFVNRQVIEFSGKTRDDFTAKRWGAREGVHPEDRPRATELFKQSIASGEPFEFEIRGLRFDGVYRWFQSRGLPLRDANGSIVRWFNLLIDIDERKRAEEALRQSEARLAAEKQLLEMVASGRPMEEVLTELCGLIENIASGCLCSIVLVDPSGTKSQEVIGPSLPAEFNEAGRDWPLDRVGGPCIMVARDKVDVIATDVVSDPRWRTSWRAIAQRHGLRSCWSTPMVSQAGVALGAFALYRRETGNPTPLQLELIGQFASIASIAIEHARREEALRQSEAQLADAKQELQLTIDTIPTLIASYWPNGERDFVSKNWQEYTGISQEEARGKDSAITFHPDRRDAGENMWQACLVSGEPYEANERLRRADGEYRWHWIRRVPLRDESGKIIKWYGVGHDIEHQKQAEAALLNSEARLTKAERELRVTLDSIPAITWRAGANGYVEQLNKRWFEYTGTTHEQVRGWRWKLCVHPDDLDQLVEIGNKYVSTGESFDSEARLRRFDGEYRWFLFRPAPVRDESGKVVAWYGTVTDIEDRKRAEAKALEAERELQHMLDSIPTMIVRGATNGYIQYLNKQWFEYTGSTLETARGFRWQESLHPDDKDRLVEFGARFVATTEPADCEARLRRHDGTYRWFLFRPAPSRDAAGNFIGWYGTVTDIEDRKCAEDALREGEARLSQAERELRLTLDSIPTMTWRAAPNGYVEQINKQFFDYTGTKPEEMQGHRWRSCVHPDDLPGLVATGDARIPTGMPFDTEARLRRSDGEYRWFLFRLAPARDEAGTLVGWYGTINDIEDRKRAEQAVRASEDNLRRIIDTIPALAWSARLNGSAEFCNQSYVDYTGLSLEQLQNWGFSNAVHPDDVDELGRTYRAVLASGRTGETEARLRRHDGEYRWFMFRATPLRDENGNPVKWYGIGYDVEDRKRAEQALAANERNLKLTVDTIPALAWSARVDGSAEFVNKHYQDFVGLSPELLQGSGWTAAVHPDDLNGLAGIWQTIMASGKAGDAEARLRRHDGEYRWFLFRANPLRDENGTIVKWYGVNTDIEDRKRAEQELRRSETLLTEGQRISSTGTYAWGGDLTERMLLSEEFYRIFEFEQGSAVTFKQLIERFHPEDLPLLAEKLERIDAGLENPEFEIRLQMPDGRIKYLRVLGRVISHQDGRLERIGAVQDITRNRQAEEALDKVRTELAHVTRVMSLGALTASIAHEVNQPLAGIVTNASTCLRMLAADPPNVEGARETARRTIRDGNRAADVITRLRALFSKQAAEPEIIDLGEAAQEILALVSTDLLRSRINVRAELGHQPLLVTGDRVQIQQVILNLVRNAMDAMSGVYDRPRDLLIRTDAEEDQACLAVTDAGVGVEAQTAEKLFDAFYTTKSDGMGIGLSVSRSIVESHGGRLWAEPNDGPGATFAFSIPRRTKNGADDGTEGAILTRPARGAHDLARNA